MGLFSRKPKPPPDLPTFAAGAHVTAVLETSLGKITAKLFADDCPVTVGNFVGLATGQIVWEMNEMNVK